MGNARNKMELIDIKDIQLKDTFKQHDDFFYTKLVALIEKFGQLKNIIVTKEGDKYTLIEGSKIYRACKQLGHEKICACVVDHVDSDLVPIAVNEHQFLTDYVRLAKVVSDLRNKYSDTALCMYLPFYSFELERFDQILNYDWKNDDIYEDKNQLKLFE